MLNVFFEVGVRVISFLGKYFWTFMKNDSTLLPNQNIADSKLVSIFKGVQETENLVSKMQKILITYS